MGEIISQSTKQTCQRILPWAAAHRTRFLSSCKLPLFTTQSAPLPQGGGGGTRGSPWGSVCGLKGSEDKEVGVLARMSSKFIWLLTFPPLLFRAAAWFKKLEQYNFIFKVEMEMKRTLNSASIVWLGFSFKEEKTKHLGTWFPPSVSLVSLAAQIGLDPKPAEVNLVSNNGHHWQQSHAFKDENTDSKRFTWHERESM